MYLLHLALNTVRGLADRLTTSTRSSLFRRFTNTNVHTEPRFPLKRGKLVTNYSRGYRGHLLLRVWPYARAGHVVDIVRGDDGEREQSVHRRAQHLPQLPGRRADQPPLVAETAVVGRRPRTSHVGQLRQDPQGSRRLHGAGWQVHVRGSSATRARVTRSRPLRGLVQGQGRADLSDFSRVERYIASLEGLIFVNIRSPIEA